MIIYRNFVSCNLQMSQVQQYLQMCKRMQSLELTAVCATLCFMWLCEYVILFQKDLHILHRATLFTLFDFPSDWCVQLHIFVWSVCQCQCFCYNTLCSLGAFSQSWGNDFSLGMWGLDPTFFSCMCVRTTVAVDEPFCQLWALMIYVWYFHLDSIWFFECSYNPYTGTVHGQIPSKVKCIPMSKRE